MKQETKIYTDGSSRGNPGPGGYAAIIVFREDENKDFTVKEIGGREEHTTNNRMELRAAIEALSLISSLGVNTETLKIYSDSSYVINGITKWIFGWKKNNWRTSLKDDVLNRDLWQKLDSLVFGKKIEWQYVAGHSGHPANERCDEIATSFADNDPVKLFQGALSEYGIDLDGPVKISAPKSKGKKAYSYVSKLDGKIETHKTWEDCKQRVLGKSGARFKKSVSAEDEQKIISEFKNS